MRNRRSMGIEIEFFGVHHELVVKALGMVGIKCDDRVHGSGMREVSRHWKLVADRSVTPDETGADRLAFGHEVESGLYEEGQVVRRGLELVSPILWNSQDFKQLKVVLRVLKTIGAKVDETCGLHVHFGVEDFELSDLKKLVMKYAESESFFDSLSPIYRRGSSNKYCKSVTFNHIDGEDGSLSWLQEYLDNYYEYEVVQSEGSKLYDPKYKKLNIRNYFSNKTIEFRHMYGCLDYDIIQTWVDMYLNILR